MAQVMIEQRALTKSRADSLFMRYFFVVALQYIGLQASCLENATKK